MNKIKTYKMNPQKNHWDKIYSTVLSNESSWWQDNPVTSLKFINSFNLSKSSAIIDIGGGDGKLVDKLLEEGFDNITVLDISEQALIKAKHRLGKNSDKVKWIVSDILDFVPDVNYDLWHDRAAFHFLLSENQIKKYIDNAKLSVNQNGFLTIGTFSENGPDKCSGLIVKQYSEQTLSNKLNNGFKKIRCITEDHYTPFGTYQNFLFCSFKRS